MNKILCISASNNFREGVKETYSCQVCRAILDEAMKYRPGTEGEIIELKGLTLSPCIDCLRCLDARRCAIDGTFNQIYEKIIACDALFIVTPHYAPIPAKLCMLLEKMEEISFEPWDKDNAYLSEVYGIPTAVISHGGGSGNGKAQKEYKRAVNDPIANALHTIQLKLIPFNGKQNTGIVIGPTMDQRIAQYVRKVLDHAGSTAR